ncbi:hypothetical protein [Lysinibacillus xylanilyticus]|uniref:hypothetical protein n=1 Tax=Lysinibacillus xylanilyticus TaxID=582475 RepID=UPI00083C9130|nr:hypothetical protein [Lysinibacillus xylanilyticus]
MKKVYVGILIIVILLLPFTINFIGNNYKIDSEANFGDWIGFWGGYFGGIVGSIAVIFTTYMIIQHEKKLSERTFLEQINLQKQMMVEQDRMEKERIKIQYELSENDEFYKKLIELQTLFVSTHNKMMELVIIKEAMHLNQIEYSIDEIVKNRDIAMESNNKFREKLIDIISNFNIVFNKFDLNDFFNIVEEYKEVLLSVRKNDFNFEEAFEILENSNKIFIEVWKEQISFQSETKKKLLTRLK